MRIRAIKPEFWRSQDISNLDIETRLLFIGLWSYVDDNGVGQDRDALIAADLFADDMSQYPRDTLARIHRGLATLHETEMITRYTVDGRHFLHVTNWEKHQRIDRPNKPRYPLPTSENAEIATPSRHPREDSSTGTGEVGTGEVGTGEQILTSHVASDDDDDVAPVEAEIIERPEVEDLLDQLEDRIRANGNRPGNRTKTAHDAIRRMIDIDGYTVEQISFIIDWSQASEFWQANILSAKKLRDKMPTLVAQARRDHQNPTREQQAQRDLADDNDYMPEWAKQRTS